MLHEEQQRLSAGDGHEIRAFSWQPEERASCIVQVLHGLGEYAGRYRRFAEAASARGYAVVAHDHRGHGPGDPTPRHFADKDGWKKLTDDVETVHKSIREQFADTPVVLLGHSMGSFVAQSFAMHYADKLAGMILSGCTWPSRAELLPAWLIAHIEKLRLGAGGSSGLLEALGFGKFNKRFEPARTPYDWISRDEGEVDKYVADVRCGGPFTCAVWLDMMRGLFAISSDHALSRIRSDLPILISGGSLDPVGGENGMGKLALHYAQTWHQHLTVKIYEGGRHEMLNEVNRDEVTRTWLDWIRSVTGAGHQA